MIGQSVNREILEDGVPMPGRIWAVLSSALTIFMSCIEGSIVNIALPVLATQFKVSSSASIWIVNGYQLMTVMCLLSVSFLADLKGFRKIYLSGIALFVLASFMCAISNSFTMLVICSAFQGIASAGIVGVNIGMLREIYPKRLLGRGIGINAMVVSVAAVSGPSVAGAILAVTSWHWLYAVNIPFGILAL
jgi:DHA2 family multidrug resistance protein-like MFS transporter